MDVTENGAGAALKVLWLARTIPLPLNSGDRIYTALLANSLAEAGADVTYLGLANPDEPMGPATELSQSARWVTVAGEPRGRLTSVLGRRPLATERFATQSYAAALDDVLARSRFDVVVLDHYALVWALPRVRRSGAALVHLAHDVETEVTRDIARAYRGNPVRKALLSANARKTGVAEAELIHACDAVVTLTDYDADVFRRLRPDIASLVIPPGYRGAGRPARTIDAGVPRQVVILGSYHWIAKQMNLTEFLDAAREPFQRAGIACCIVGSVPSPLAAEWRARYDFANFMGFVDDVQTVLDRSRLGLVVETTGGGFKLKMLDYVFNRVPVAGVGDSLRGLDPAVARHTLLAPDAGALAGLVVATIDDLSRLDAMQDGAFEAASGLYRWPVNGRRLLDFMQGLAQRLGRRVPESLTSA